MAIPLCKDCKHFNSRGECQKFKYVDMVHGGSKHFNAYTVRMSDIHCTKTGRFFQKRTVPYIVTVEDDVPDATIMCSIEGTCSVIYDVDAYNLSKKSVQLVYAGVIDEQ